MAINYGKTKKIELIFGNFYFIKYLYKIMNLDILSNIFSYLKIEKISNIMESKESSNELNNRIISSLTTTYKTSFTNIKSKINNYQHKCGFCNSNLIGDYVVKLGLTDCKVCDEKNNFNIELCNICSNTNLKRGQITRRVCKNNHENIYLGINILS